MKKNYLTDVMREQQEIEKPKRLCTTCGEPTHNYRCDACWNKLRKAEAGETGPLFSDWQKEFAAIRTGPRTAEPEYGGKTVNPERKTYTYPELAKLLDVSIRDISNARIGIARNFDLKPRPGSGVYKVIEGMRARGITWDQVISIPKGKKFKPLERSAPSAAGQAISIPKNRGKSKPPECSAPSAAEYAEAAPAHAAAARAVDGAYFAPSATYDLKPVPFEALLGEIFRRMQAIIVPR